MLNQPKPEAAVRTGDVIDARYRLLKVIGEGGMGTVYLAEHLLIKRKVAIKLLHPEFIDDVNVIERFMNEARAAGTLGHPNIVESTDMGFTDSTVPYIVFEFLEGTLLTDEIYRLGGLPIRRAVRIAQKIASALQAAHSAGIVHRDLKSDNVFLTDKDDLLDHVKVLDFGISRFMEVDDEQTRRGMVMGTPEFMAPEQITAPNSVDARADIYALGVILYEMLAAKRPFQNDEPRTLLHRIVHDEPPQLERAEAPIELIALVMRLLAKEPTKRMASMLEVESALASFFTLSDVTDRQSSRFISHGELADLGRRSRADIVKANAGDLPGVISPGSLPSPSDGKKTFVANHWKSLSAGAACLLLGIAGVSVMGKGTAAPAPVATVAVAPAAIASVVQPLAAVEQKITVKVEGPANAMITFRRKVTAAPAVQTIAASNIIEMVEVSAPKHKTVRYWLTLDRNTRLTAQLPVGVGVVEASDQDTLIALGEMPAPVSQAAASIVVPAAKGVEVRNPQPSQPLAVASAKTLPNDVRTPAAPRKIGRGVEPAGVDIETILSANDSAQRPAVDAQADQLLSAALAPSEESKPVAGRVGVTIEAADTEPVVQKVTRVEQPVAELAKPQDAAKTEAVPAPTTVVVAAPPPQISQAMLSTVVAAHRGEILKCFDAGRKRSPDIKGVVTVTLPVTPDGSVVRPQVKSTLGAPMVAACIASAVNSWKFPARPGTGLTTVSYPFALN